MAISASFGVRVAGALAAGAAVAAAVAGCSSGSSSTSVPPVSPASSASSPAASSAPASASASASTPAAALSPHAVTGTTTSPAGGGGAAGCATKDLRATVVNAEGAAGSVYQNIDFTNTGPASCTLYGYPGVSLGAGTPFTQIGTAATRSTAAPPAVVTLAPGQTGNALLRVTQAQNYPPATCSPKTTTYLQIYPPGQTAAIYLAFKSTGCTSKAVNLLSIGVVQAGATSSGQ
jgi:hypothetical protein